jgi:hypothetical protein
MKRLVPKLMRVGAALGTLPLVDLEMRVNQGGDSGSGITLAIVALSQNQVIGAPYSAATGTEIWTSMMLVLDMALRGIRIASRVRL